MLTLLLISAKWVGLSGIVVAGVFGFFRAEATSPVTHSLIGLIFTFLFSLSQVMTVYYFVGMRTAIESICRARGLDDDIPKQARALVRDVVGRGVLLAILATVTLIAAGVGWIGRIPFWIHPVLAGVIVALGVRAGIVEYRAFVRNAAIFERVTGQRRV
ncbi:MAG TPA: hypothetical protein VM118_12500 [Acidobacteriota bacterium]|nr:hypothetical protein [Acidobacteriota bacterium]